MVFISLEKIQLVNVILLFAGTLFAWLLAPPEVAMAVLVGGLLVTLSFIWLTRDVRKIFNGPLQNVKLLFFVKYYARLSLLAVILFGLIRYHLLHVVGLLLGLSSIVVSILLVGASEARKKYYGTKEAA